MRRKTLSAGFTLAEVLIVVAILIIILILLLMNLRTQMRKANDIKRKTDLAKIQKSFEEYFNDKESFPQPDILDECNGTQLGPYLGKIPCDPVTKTPYLYVDEADLTTGYRLCAKLEYLSDPDITRIGCDPVIGCGWEEGYNYCLSAGVAAASSNISAGGGDGAGGDGGEVPTPTAVPGVWACTPGGQCNMYGNPLEAGCPWTYDNQDCIHQGVAQCQFPANRCEI